jgi:aldose 1-epimerase
MSAESAEPSLRVHRFRGEAAVTLAAGGTAGGTEGLEATYIPRLGMLGAALRHRGQDLLALSGGLAGYRAGRTTGLPLLAPWANRLGGFRYEAAGIAVDLDKSALRTDQNGLPIHGTMAAHEGWTLLELSTTDTAALLRARFDYGAWPSLLAAFPFRHELEMEVRVRGDRLEVVTTLRPNGDSPVPVSFGYHPYFRLPRARRALWRLELPGRDHLTLDERGLPTGDSTPEPAEREPLADRRFDDLYALGSDRRLAISDGSRRLVLACEEGYPYAQVFTPTGRNAVCLEPMTAPTNALGTGSCPLVGPGDAYTARFAIIVEETRGSDEDAGLVSGWISG